MRKWIAAALLVVFAWLAASVVFPVQVTSADPLCQITYNNGPFNRANFTIFSPVEGWHHVDFGNGAATDVEVIGGRGTTWTDYATVTEDYEARVSGSASCMIIVIITNPDQPSEGGGGETPVEQPAQVPTAPLGCDLNMASEQPIVISGNHVTGSIQIQGGDKEWPLVDYFGINQDTARREDNTIWINGHVPLGADGVFSISIVNRHSGVVCRTYEFHVQDSVVSLSDGTSATTPVTEEPQAVSNEAAATEGNSHGWSLDTDRNGWWVSQHVSMIEGELRFLGICPEAVNVTFNADASLISYEINGISYTTNPYGKHYAVEGCAPW